MEPDTVIISLEEYEDLCERSLFLEALERAGVDNWDGIDFAQEIFQDMLNDDGENVH